MRFIIAAIVIASSTAALAAAPEPPPGAASCTGCHATNPNVDTAVPRLTGKTPGEIVAAMQAFRSGQKPATIMDRIAKGFSDTEVQAIATWLTEPH